MTTPGGTDTAKASTPGLDDDRPCAGLSPDDPSFWLCRLVREMQRERQRERRLVFAMLALVAVAVATVGVNLYAMIYQMSDDMTAMADAMGRTVPEEVNGGSATSWFGLSAQDRNAQQRLVEGSMAANMANMEGYMRRMSADMAVMSEVMGTMGTMGRDMHSMSGNLDVMARDVSQMTAAVGAMSQGVGILSSMTPAVQRMSTDTSSMGRDLHRMMPFNWFPPR